MVDDVWARVDEAVGAQVLLAAQGDGWAATTAALTLVRRDDADPIDSCRAVAAALEAYLLAPGVEIARLPARAVPRVRFDVRAGDEWLTRLGFAREAIRQRATWVRRSMPSLTSEGALRSWCSTVDEVGEDAAVWAAVRSASRAAPLVVAPDVETLAGRRDANPLALLRRAHAALVLQHPAALDSEPDAGAPSGTPDVSMRLALLEASRAAHDAVRTERSRPAALAAERLAAASLAHLEAAPATRTDLPATRVARSIIGDALCAAGVAAPVPY